MKKLYKTPALQTLYEGAKTGKYSVTLHTEPSSVSTAHIGSLLIGLAQIAECASKLPGHTWPIHVRIEMGGKWACGSIAPVSIVQAEGGTSFDPSDCQN